MEKADIDRRRKALFAAALDAIERDWSDLGRPVRRRADRLLLEAENGTELLLQLSSVKQGYGFEAGEFGVNSSLIVGKGPIHDLMRKLGALDGAESADGRIFQTGSLGFRRNAELYALRLTDDAGEVAAHIASDLKKHAHPQAKHLVTHQADVLQSIAKTPDAFEKPFGTAAAVLALNGRLSELEKFWAATKDESSGDESSLWDRPATAGELRKLRTAAAKAVE